MSLDELTSIICVKCQGEGWASIPPPRCLDCLGSGKNNCDECLSTGEVQCMICDGSGYVECTLCYGDSLVDCDACQSTGIMGDFTKVKCTRCNGQGSNNGIPCTRCSGTGKVDKEPDRCKTCNGEGQIKCENCDSGKIDCVECELGMRECSVCGGEGEVKCRGCGGTGKSGKNLVYKCDLCHGQGKKEINFQVSAQPDLAHLHRMLAVMYSKVEEGQKMTANQVATISRKLKSRDLVTEAQLNTISSKFTNVEDALNEMKSLKSKLMESNGSSTLSCMLCGYVPSGTTTETWLSSKDYGKSITCDACFAVFKL